MDWLAHIVIFVLLYLCVFILYPFVRFFFYKKHIPLAIQIAELQGWVTVKDLRKVTKLPIKECQKIIDKAVKKELLHHGEGALYYLAPSAHDQKANSN